jgi:2-oxo-4-hydroxy-4-carboxy-5-ureidoimidazoline decarboxylase
LVPVTLEELNTLSAADLRPRLLACADVPAWTDTVLAGRPYVDLDDLEATADRAAQGFTSADVDRALAAHPRIGEKAKGAGTEAAWSLAEQAAVSRDTDTEQALAEGNRAYEDRFGRVFLICATGLSGAEILASLQVRLGNDEATEQAVVADELRKIALVRLRKVVGS